MDNISINDILNLVNDYSEEELNKIKKAYEYASNLHSHQFRDSNEPYIIHPLNVAYILASIHADSDTICAGLLHDTLEDTVYTKEEMCNDFGESITLLVDGVTKISKMSYSSKEERNYANTRKIITSITKDIRIIIIKLADRLHNMRTLQYKEPKKQKENALETMEIFVPIAYFIGAYKIKNELEDLSFYYLNKDKYCEISDKRKKMELLYRDCLFQMREKLTTILADNNVPCDIRVRTKNVYGIYKRLVKSESIGDIHDLFSMKIIVDELFNCYKTLCLVHQCYNPINGKFKDFICNPKTNRYQSLHTTVFGPEERLVQTQIRTYDMDRINNYGLTAYWDINKDEARIIMQEDLSRKYQFFKSLVEIDSVFADNRAFVNRVKNEIFNKQVYFYDALGNTIELPEGSTLLDYAYSLSDYYGDNLQSGIVNGKSVGANYVIQNKDRVRILLNNSLHQDRSGLIGELATTKARERILELRNKNTNKK